MGLGSTTNALLQGTFQTEYEVGPAVTAWINAVRQTDEEKSIPPVIGSLSTTEFQEGKIGDSYSLEVRVIAHVHTILYNFFCVSPQFSFLFISHPDVTVF